MDEDNLQTPEALPAAPIGTIGTNGANARKRGRVTHEPNYARRHHRVTVPLLISIDGVSYRAADWSLGGFHLTDYAGPGARGDELDGTLILPYAHFTVNLPVRFRIVRSGGEDIGCEFVDLGEVQHKALRHVMEAAVEGRLADVADALATLEEPIAAPQLAQLLEDEDDRHVYIAGRRLFRMSVLYAVLGVAAVCLVAALVLRNALFVDVDDGVIMGNFISVTTAIDGRLRTLHVREGQFVAKGQALFDMDNEAAALAVDRARTSIHTANVRIRALDGRIEEEEARLVMFGAVTTHQIAMTEAGLARVDAQGAKAAADLARQRRLFEEAVVSRDALELAQRDLDALVAERDELLASLEIHRLNEQATREGRFFGGTQMEGELRTLREDRRVTRARLAEAEQRLASALLRLDQTHAAAPQEGYVYTIHRQTGELLAYHDTVLSLRTHEGYFAVGRLSGDEAVKIRPGQAVDVLIPSMDLRLRGVVSAIGHHGLSISPDVSPDLESALNEVPIKIALPTATADIPPGMRARLRIHLHRDSSELLPGADGVVRAAGL